MTFFALHAYKYTRETMQRELQSPEALVDLAVERLQRHYPTAERRGGAILVEANADQQLAIQRLASAEPYLFEGRRTFLPYRCSSGGTEQLALAEAGESWSRPILAWKGTLADSRLELTFGDQPIADGACTIQPRGHHVYIARTTEDDDIATLFKGQPITRPTRWTGPQLLLVARRSAPEDARSFIVFESGSELVYFSRHPDDVPRAETALVYAELCGLDRMLVIVKPPPEGWRPPEFAGLTIATTPNYDHLRVVAAGPSDALDVFTDQLREALSGFALAVARATPNEPADALIARATSA